MSLRHLPVNAPLQYLQDHTSHYLEALKRYIAFPSISASPDCHKQVQHCADHTAQLLREAGMTSVEVHATSKHPIVTGSWLKASDRPTLLIYGHYDVQPVDPLNLWHDDPFTLTLRNDRLFARGSVDDKGQIFMHIKAVEAWIKSCGDIPVNVQFIIEGEEEIGSPNLPDFLKHHRDILQADLALISDSSMWAEGIPAITVSLRGMALLEIELSGPDRDLHSGGFGGAVANPIEMLCRLLASVKRNDGTIRIPGFYDDVRELSSEQRARLRNIPFDETAYLKQLGVKTGWGEKNYTILEQRWHRPTFEINGLWGGFTDSGVKTVLPAQAHAKISLRLVPDQDPDRIVEIVSHYLKQQIPDSVKIRITRIPGGGRGVTTPPESPAISAAQRALTESFGRKPLLVGDGGSIPVVSHFKDLLNLETLLIGFGLPDSSAHAPNENLHLPTFRTGMEGLVRFLGYL